MASSPDTRLPAKSQRWHQPLASNPINTSDIIVCGGSRVAGSGGRVTPAQELPETGKLFLFVLLAASDAGVRV